MINNTSTLTLKGRGIYDWIERLDPFLDGHNTLEELVHNLPADKRTMVTDLIGLLERNGFVDDTIDDRPHGLTEVEQRTYAEEIAFIGYFCDSAAARFESFRSGRYLVVGSGLSSVAAIRALLHLGPRRVDASFTRDTAADRHWLAEAVGAARRRDPDQQFVEVEEPPWDSPAALAQALAPYTAVVHATDRPMPQRSAALEDACVAAGIACAQAAVVGDIAWVGPLWAPGLPIRWRDAWRRLLRNRSSQNHDAYGWQDRPTAEVSPLLTSPTAAIAVSQLAFEMFKRLTGIPAVELEGRVLRLDLRSLASRVHRVPPGPGRLAVSSPREDAISFRDRYEQRRAAPPVTEEAFSTAVRDCVDEEFGVLQTVDEADFPQLPLNVCAVSFTAATPDDRVLGTVEVLGSGAEFGQARRRAARRACELYAAMSVDPARLVDDREVWGMELVADEPVLLPATAAFPILGGRVPDDVTLPYVGSAATWDDAVARALARFFAHRAAARLADNADAPLLDLRGRTLTADAAAYLRQLKIIGKVPRIRDMSAENTPVILAFGMADHTIVEAGFDEAAVVEAGLAGCLLMEQVTVGDRDTGLIVAPPMPIASKEPSGQTIRNGPAPGTVLRALAAHGRRLAAVPLDHDAAVRSGCPNILTLVEVSK
ncbi:hypothetical protein ACIBCN_02185 [Nocardia sp. NPDC051052]|uniref:hypothetical protein n=1 Tax=Nocardia sp. NPDC051052 TaxID=3364322 RepID=UPI0037B52E02